jgi:hypothetical protein
MDRQDGLARHHDRRIICPTPYNRKFMPLILGYYAE